MKKLLLKILISFLAIFGIYLGGNQVTKGIIGSSQASFDVRVPMAVGVKDSKGNLYGVKLKAIDKYGLTDDETQFTNQILAGNGPTGAGETSPEQISEMYYNVAIKMGLTPADIVNGVNLYEYIRK